MCSGVSVRDGEGTKEESEQLSDACNSGGASMEGVVKVEGMVCEGERSVVGYRWEVCGRE